jgi:hypothetical protein
LPISDHRDDVLVGTIDTDLILVSEAVSDVPD